MLNKNTNKVLDITDMLHIENNRFINFNKIDIGTDYISESRTFRSLYPRDIFFKNQYILKIIEDSHRLLYSKVKSDSKYTFSKSADKKAMDRKNTIDNIIDNVFKYLKGSDYQEHFSKSITDYIDDKVSSMKNKNDIVILLDSYSLKYISKNCNIDENINHDGILDEMFFTKSMYIYRNKYPIYLTESLDNQIVIMNFKLDIEYSDYYIDEKYNNDVYEYQEEYCNFSIKITKENESNLVVHLEITD